MRRKSKVWELINRERKGRKGINEGIEMKEWREYFRNLLGGVEERIIAEGSGEREEGREEKKELRVEEIREALK